jgi:hypothetical protein
VSRPVDSGINRYEMCRGESTIDWMRGGRSLIVVDEVHGLLCIVL